MKTEQLIVRVDPRVREVLIHLADESNRSVSNYVETLILRDMRERGEDWKKAV